MSAQAIAAGCLFVAGVLLTGCASMTAPTQLAHSSPTQLCALDALLWSYGFVPRATDRQCVTILETVKIREE